MEEWIEKCTEYYGTLSWEGVCKMIKTVHHHQEEYVEELTQREIDLACNLKDKRKVYLSCSFFSLFQIVLKHFSRLCLLIYLFTESGMMQLIHHNATWCNGRKFRIKKLDDKKKKFDCGINPVFQVN